MKKPKNAIYIRYEFSNEAGQPEGGDILHFSSLEEIQEFASEILEVAHGDKVTVNLTIGREKPFFGFLESVGLSRKAAEKEMVGERPVAALEEKKKAPKKRAASRKVRTKKK